MGQKRTRMQRSKMGYPVMEHINPHHPLVRLAALIDWPAIERLTPRSEGPGRPPLRGRLIAGLLYLQHAFALSDEEVMAMWIENAYWQVFTGEVYLQTAPPIDPSSLSRWRKRLGEAGVEELLAQSIEAAQQWNLRLRQNYNRLAPRLLRQIGRYASARQYKRMHRLLRKLRSRVGRIYREVERQLDQVPQQHRQKLTQLLGATKRILTQRPKDKKKLYALHAPEVECIAKGKVRTPYEFGVKVSVVTTLQEGLVVGARSMPGYPYDGHTLDEALEQTEILSEVKPEQAFVDRGFKGVTVDGVQIWISGQKCGVTRALRAMIKRRSAIEPTIGH